MTDETPTAASVWLVMARAYRSMETYLTNSLSQLGIGLSDFMILEILLHKGPMSMSSIGEKVLLANGSMTAAADRLEKLGYVSRCSEGADKRVRNLGLTAEGRKVSKKLFTQHERDIEAVMTGLCPNQRRMMREGLKSIGLAARAAGQRDSCNAA